LHVGVMTRPARVSLEQVYVADRAAWRRWLAANHASSPGIWLVFDKKSSRPDRLAYVDAVEEALCYGWIDSTARTLDDTRYVQLMAPRKPKSTWARTNKARVERLIAHGLMAEAGLAAIERAKANGSWESLDAVEAMVMPEDLLAALAAIPGAAERFAAFAPSARKGYLPWIHGAVRPETRAHRVSEVARHAAANRKSRHLDAAPAAKSATTRAKAAGRDARTATKSAKTAKPSSTGKGSSTAKRAGTAKRRKSR
jgi:uncharacterized protein YdeI (YjbR/CyaY-like superfamily)